MVLYSFRQKIFGVVGPCVASLALLSCQTQAPGIEASQSAPAEATLGVGAIGHVVPGDGVVRVAARSLGGQPSIVARLLVAEGETVKKGQPIAELDSKQQLEGAWRQAQARIAVARSRLDQVQAHAKASDVAVQEAEIARIEAEHQNARAEHKRYVSLGENVTSSQVETLQLRVDSTARALSAARQRLVSLTEVRPVDIEVARAELVEATRNEERSRAEYNASILRSPIDGRVVEISARPGEQVGEDGVLQVAPTDPMYVVAEVAESDIQRIKIGQRATITADALTQPVDGRVDRIALQVQPNQLMPVDPARFSDGRVVNVWVKVNENQAVADRINLRVDVVFQP